MQRYSENCVRPAHASRGLVEIAAGAVFAGAADLDPVDLLRDGHDGRALLLFLCVVLVGLDG